MTLIFATAALAVLGATAGWTPPVRSWHRPLALTLTVGFLIAGGLVFGLFVVAGFDLEHDGTLLWTAVAVAAVVLSALASALHERTAAWELAAAILGVMFAAGAAAAAVSGEGADSGLASAPVRALLVAAPLLILCGYFGSSVGFLLRGSGETDAQWGYEARVGRRFLLSKASPVVSTVTTISVVGVSLGVAAVMVSLAVLAGFENDLREKIIGAHSHALLQRTDRRPFTFADAERQTLSDTPGVVAFSPVIEGEVAVASRSNYSGAIVLGIDPNQSKGVLKVLDQVIAGSIDPLTRELTPILAAEAPDEALDAEFAPPRPLPNIVIGAEMARSLSVQTGDTVRMLSPTLGTLTPVGLTPKSLGFRVAGIFASKMYEYDAKLAFVSSSAARGFFELPERSMTGMLVQVEDPDTSDRVGAALLEELANPAFNVLDWKSRNQTLFAALKLERIVAFVVLAFIILVASFSIVNTLTMSVIEKRKEIAILKTMGARDVGIMKVFLVQGLTVGAFGTLLGAALGLTLIGVLKAYGFWIPDDVYYIDSLPIHLEPLDAVLVVAAALLIVWNFAVFPALRGSQLAPVEGLRDG